MNKMLTVLLVIAAIMVAACGSQPAGKITEFPISTAKSSIVEITAGPDGNLWFTEQSSSQIGRSTPSGQITEFPLPNPNSEPGGITAGPDGNLWFTDCVLSSSTNMCNNNQIGRITPSGQITEFPLPNPNYTPNFITKGPDGNLWFTECVLSSSTNMCNNNQIGRITPSGQITEFPLSNPSSSPGVITAGPDGNLWFTEPDSSQIGRITPAGQITEFPLSNPSSSPSGITAGPDGNLWFTEPDSGQIGRITPAGQITEFPLPIAHSPDFITAGPDGNLWFTEQIGRIGRITPTGQITEFPLPIADLPDFITAGPDGNLWFTEQSSTQIGRITSGK